MGLKFSQRIGKTPVREALQVEGMDKGLENLREQRSTDVLG